MFTYLLASKKGKQRKDGLKAVYLHKYPTLPEKISANKLTSLSWNTILE
jgi:hypothetical protein